MCIPLQLAQTTAMNVQWLTMGQPPSVKRHDATLAMAANLQT